MSDAAVDQGRRTWIAITCGAGAVGGAAVAVPFVSTFSPSERARAAGAPVEVDISKLAPGERMTVEWRGKPVWVLRRTPEQVEELKKLDGQLADPNSERTAYPIPAYAKNTGRSIKPEYLVVIGICTHLGCSPGGVAKNAGNPSVPSDWPGGFLCPCHGSTFDLAGRVFKNKPAPDNLEVPPHMYLSDAVLLIGEDKKA
ncbi:ubiquinol-cytochrome c reductase iron-sulfur subunit [Rubrivivax gelatinosus]|uniref:Ubiquinol-cytochrome c reductase iron-sulfur subunit n=1 Tax=Rubrivivax gelatinosus TaxID=28068 RepID=A0ABS1DT60_RUBGE|nr:ubiquinol-cytochrome c reductase iron-sulfur subunit [Rubrivivax gelatinosus]MBK1615188.1 ubiquinol-cytochrome c reductase iron-sulfur subunit [Rubrivivax gelatinosus]MBK1712519.1 ubiquinol-cytochrome c reductase iron-sulfur subunit [Rubrivivax gelatinosus]